MKRILQLLFWATLILLMAQFLPGIYNYVTVKASKTPFTLYSSVEQEFVQIQNPDGNLVRCSKSGKVYTEAEFDSVLPFFYLRQLVTDGRFPKTVQGVEIHPQQAQKANFMYRYSPGEYYLNPINLYPLFDGMSGRVDLKMPKDFFRTSSSGIEFIEPAGNKTDKTKSKLFTDKMLTAGFVFPAKKVWGNPTPRKEYDEGYFLLDSDNKLFHLKMLKERPYIKQISTPDQVVPAFVSVTEFRNQASYAFMAGENNKFYYLQKPGYKWVELPIGNFDYKEDRMLIIGNQLDWTIQVAQGNENKYFALNASDLKPLDQMTSSESPATFVLLSKYIFPFRLNLVTPYDEEVKLRFSDFSYQAFILQFILALIVFMFIDKRKFRWSTPATFLFGIFILIPYLAYKNYFTED